MFSQQIEFNSHKLYKGGYIIFRVSPKLQKNDPGLKMLKNYGTFARTLLNFTIVKLTSMGRMC